MLRPGSPALRQPLPAEHCRYGTRDLAPIDTAYGQESRRGPFGLAACRRRGCLRVADPEFAKSPGAPFKSEAMDRDSVHQHRQGSGSDRWHRVDQEAAAIGGDRILEQYDTRCDDSRLEEGVRNACDRLVMRGVDSYRHKLFVHGDIEEVFSIRTPARLCAAMIGYLDSPAWAGETTYIHFRTLSRTRRPKSGESDPFPIGRKLCFGTRCVGCLRMVPEVKNVQLLSNTVLKIHVDEKTPIRRPAIANQKIGLRHSLQFDGTIRSSNVDVLRSSGIIDFISHPFAVR